MGALNENFCPTVHRSFDHFADQHQLPDAFQKVLLQPIYFNNRRHIGRKLKP